MAIKHLTSIDLSLNQLLSALFENLGADPGSGLSEGRVIYRTDLHVPRVYANGGWHTLLLDNTTLNAIALATADVDINNHKLVNLSTPTNANDATNKSYVDALYTGQDWKNSVRVASTANVSVTSAPATIDGITLAANDRILLKNQTTGSENGIYTFASAGTALTRATDANTSAMVTSGMTVIVEAGTVNADTIWILTTQNPIVLGTTALTITQLPGATYTAGNGITLTGSAFSVNVDNVTLDFTGSALEVKALGITGAKIAAATIDLTTKVTGVLPIANGGTNANTAPLARAALGATTKVAANITGNGALTTFTVNHALGTTDVIVQVVEATTLAVVLPDIVITDANNVTINFAVAPANAKVYRVNVIG